ncbi:hypothetical protein [Psychrobacter celer]|uniref:hypothetical protein n=1 Tax=Psychrobacter celer TaxID=306572 RepID=UPI0025972F98|nr:hypothetical protein [uncultured Psychrobacter sp.]
MSDCLYYFIVWIMAGDSAAMGRIASLQQDSKTNRHYSVECTGYKLPQSLGQQ